MNIIEKLPKNPWIASTLLVLGMKLTYWLFAVLLHFSYMPSKSDLFALPLDSQQFGHYGGDSLEWPEYLPVGALRPYSDCDTRWYGIIATNWYRRMEPQGFKDTCCQLYGNQCEHAFMPFFPGSIRLFMKTSGLDFWTSGFIVSTLFSIICFAMLIYWALHFFQGDRVKVWSCVLLVAVFPFSYFYFVTYTEAIYLACMVTGFWGIYTRNYWALGISCVLLPWIRVPGITAVVPFGLALLEREGLLKGFMPQWGNFSIKHFLPSLFVLLVPISFALYCIYMEGYTGDYLAFNQAVKAWGREGGGHFPLFSLFKHGDWKTVFQSIYACLFLMLTIFLYRKKWPVSLQSICWIGIYLPLSSGEIHSIGRYISVLFPLFALISTEWVAHSRYKGLIMFVLFVFQLLTYSFWLYNGYGLNI